MKMFFDIFAVIGVTAIGFYGMFGIVPNLLSQPSSFLVSCGVALAITILAATVLAAIKLYERFTK